MSLFTISDLHLSFGSDKPMDIFNGWDDYTHRIKNNWIRVVDDDDTVVLPGDLSWALKLENSEKDLEFINSLPGKKLILKGNHDLWWGTSKKMKEYFAAHHFDTLDIVHNNCFTAAGFAIAGTRGWFFDDNADKKIILREAGRLTASLTEAEKTGLETVVFLHYPPAYGDMVCEEIFDVIRRFGVKKVYYGHIHGAGRMRTINEYEGVRLQLVSCDCVDFTPVLVI